MGIASNRYAMLAALLGLVCNSAMSSEGVEPKLQRNADVIRRLEAIEPNHGVLLGEAAVVGDLNETARKYNLDKTGPRARDFTLKMCWAPDRKRALFCGANHGVPHRLNDVWEFDLPSLTWVMLFVTR